MRARPVARAQVARQEGEHLAALLSRYKLVPAKEPAADSNARADRDGDGHEDGAAARDGDIIPMPKGAPSFRYLHLGSLAYLGEQKGVMDLPIKMPFLKTLRGRLGADAWRLLETLMQVSPRTRWLVANDWIRSFLFGRNISDI
ncbi:hypothetical protein MNEG_9994 [Monoraphidium neglectum]|uniref:NADH:ubiquinone reductase (non-electrogenic) n=1 Tax=Monoraphidium neglectum TaxID=145388 RepID=A0A0D2JEG3_9CHLO|nr:hypothetical protein MNEG_9994 [Monoraphidium neglectum]KIY97967.1 hypothetical protein MNEG_9994 [Monoraphidium neglectum]|eukprot:XP_013896987.1 hypothetical protein MNEG_9994 [Monoraphidium neglectum]